MSITHPPDCLRAIIKINPAALHWNPSSITCDALNSIPLSTFAFYSDVVDSIFGDAVTARMELAGVIIGSSTR
jgi:hypothetical protein